MKKRYIKAVCLNISLLLILCTAAVAKNNKDYLAPCKMNAYPATFSSHVAAAATIMEHLGCKENKEQKKDFLARISLFARKCECDKPQKPYIYPLYDGLLAFIEAYDYKLTIKERYRDSKSRGISFAEIKKELKAEKLAIITILKSTNDIKAAESNRTSGISYPVSGYLVSARGRWPG